MSDSLHLIATMRSRPGKSAELREHLESLVEPTRSEPGCISYRLMEDREVGGRFVFVEEWVDEAALEAHFETPHFRGGLARFSELVEGELDLTRLRLVR